MRKLILFIYLVLVVCSSNAQDVLLDSVQLAQARTFTNLKEALKEPDKVYKLSLVHQKLDSLPKEIVKFKNLQVLNLRGNRLTEIPKEIGTLTHLQWLDMSRNKIVSVDDALGDLIHLKYLELSRNDIERLPPTIGKLVELEKLIMWDTNLNDVPDEIQNLKNLQFLELRDILMTPETQDRIKALLPDTKISFSPTCNCKL